MKKIIPNQPAPVDVISINEAFENFYNGRGIIVSVYLNKASMLIKKRDAYCFRKFGCGQSDSEHTSTEGPLSNIKNRFFNPNENKGVDFYYFEGLADFARAVVDKGWS